jgi:Mg-chelatase subunit ChlD
MIQFNEIWPLFLLIIPLAIIAWKWRALWDTPIGDRLAIIFRLLAVALAIVAFSGPQLMSWVDSHYVYFMADLSRSVHPTDDYEDIIDLVNQLAVPEANTQYGFIVFGEQAYVELPLDESLDIEDIYSNVQKEGSNLQAALDLALATLPDDGKKSIVLLSDGQPSEGGLSESLARARREGVEIYTMPIYPPSSEFSILSMQAPPEVAVELPFSFQNVIYASRPNEATLLVYRNETLITSEDIELRPGLNYISLNDELKEPGVYEYRVELAIQGDSLAQNNVYRDLVEAVGDPRILMVGNDTTGVPTMLEDLLDSSGYAFTETSLEDFAPTASSLLSYRAVVLNDVPLRNMSPRQVEYLENYVRDLGGGLFVVQGRDAVEEFYDREFERILPITYEGPEELQRPALALVMLLDRSGSMGENAGGALKIDLLKGAAIEAVKRLEPTSLVGIVGFDSQYEWLVPLEQIQGRRDEIAASIGTLFPNGGTDVYDALEDAIQQLQGVEARVKHILVFSDGKVSQEGRNFSRLFQQIEGSTISASSIAIGSQADFNFLWGLADVGGGAKYPVADANDLPRITLEEMVRLEKARWIRGPLGVEPGPYSYDLSSINTTAVPDVDGYVLTFEKPAAQTMLNVRSGDQHLDPLITRWRYGLGEVYVLNTSFDSEGIDRWKSWSDISALTGNILGQVYSESTLQPSELTVWTEFENSQLAVNVEAEKDGKWLDLLPIKGQLNSSEGEVIPVEIEQTGPGSYEAHIENLDEGVYLLNIGDEDLGNVKEAIHVPYASEYQKIGLNDQLLQQISDITGGQYLENPNRLVDYLEGRTQAYRDIWQEVLLAGLLFFMLDLIARKLPFPTG